jgi:hypothetical protein
MKRPAISGTHVRMKNLVQVPSFQCSKWSTSCNWHLLKVLKPSGQEGQRQGYGSNLVFLEHQDHLSSSIDVWMGSSQALFSVNDWSECCSAISIIPYTSSTERDLVNKRSSISPTECILGRQLGFIAQHAGSMVHSSSLTSGQLQRWGSVPRITERITAESYLIW